MPTTRSTTRSASAAELASAVPQSAPLVSQNVNKRKSVALSTQTPKRSTKKRKENPDETSRDNSTSEDPQQTDAVPMVPAAENIPEENVILPAILSFSFEDAKSHLVSVDPRFEDVFAKMKCKPFEELDRVHPFRALTMSILGQQVSWIAARSIIHKFRRLYDQALPEKPGDDDDAKSVTSSFPTPEQVAKTDIATLRTAGLSQRKAEYIQGLAERFADGRLSSEKLLNADDDALTAMLTEVRGVGLWTVNMFAIFSLRRPDILPVGDLGVQRGVVRWFLSLHSPSHHYSVSPEKKSAKKKSKKEVGKSSQSDELPSLHNGEPVDVSSVPPAVIPTTGKDEVMPSLPPAFTPSIKKVLEKDIGAIRLPDLPQGLTVSVLKSRLEGKKIKGAFLTPKEMEDLTEPWRPYRSIAVYYMWSLADMVAVQE